ncbi:unnamed protein product [Symbiodinium microadriaticum]|nr:unnamed protein product [Symbiodinium sp. KB8]CAE7561582.1 unnamed protein product [Symbiodinium microadriaticum]
MKLAVLADRRAQMLPHLCLSWGHRGEHWNSSAESSNLQKADACATIWQADLLRVSIPTVVPRGQPAQHLAQASLVKLPSSQLDAHRHIVATAVAVESQAVLLRTERSETNQPIATCKGQFAGHCESFLKDESRCRSAYASWPTARPRLACSVPLLKADAKDRASQVHATRLEIPRMAPASYGLDALGALPLQPVQTGFFSFDPEKLLCAGGGPWYDCRLNKWGDHVVACEKWCGMPPLIPLFWLKSMFTDCKFTNMHPDDDGFFKLPFPDIGGLIKAKMALLSPLKFEPWRGWPIREEDPMKFDPNGGLPDDSTREITKICCQKPTKKCLTIGEPTVVVRALPAAVATLFADEGLLTVQRHHRGKERRLKGRRDAQREAQEFL